MPPTDSDNGILTAPERNNFFYGKLMDVAQFRKEQGYFNQQRRLLNRLMFGQGVVCGLNLVGREDGLIELQPGVAIDGQGREIIVPQAVAIDPSQPTDDAGNPAGDPLDEGTVVSLCLAYAEIEADPVPVVVPDCDTRNGCACSTICESFVILVRATEAAPIEPACGLPELFTSTEGEAGVPNIYPALVDRLSQACPAPAAEVCVVLAQVTLAPEDEAPAIELDVRPLVVNNALLLELILCLAERVEACCGQEPEPSPEPETRLVIEEVEFINIGDQTVGTLDLSDLSIVPEFPNQPLQSILVRGDKEIEPATVVAGTTEPETFSFLVTAEASDIFPEGFVPGSITFDINEPTVFRFDVDPDLRTFPPGIYTVELFGDEDPTGTRPAIASTDGSRLDGDLDGTPGGNLRFSFRIS